MALMGKYGEPFAITFTVRATARPPKMPLEIVPVHCRVGLAFPTPLTVIAKLPITVPALSARLFTVLLHTPSLTFDQPRLVLKAGLLLALYLLLGSSYWKFSSA